MAKITLIEKQSELPRQLNVCAYARVSCDKDTMLHSLFAQVSYFSGKIQSEPAWNYVGVYSDYAKSGTKSTRGDFEQMFRDAEDGKIDLILVKSLTRFARNTELTLKWIRRMKAIDVDIYFEEERIHTLSADGELLLTLLASSAQEQSRTCSLNTLWRVKKNFREGIPYGGNSCMGYSLCKGKFTLIPEEAEIVRLIFRLYIEGNGFCKIAKTLNGKGIKAYEGGLWSKNSVGTILRNRNYTGDLILQKTYRESYLTKKTLKNRGEKDMYIVEDNHEPIVSKEIFEKAKAIREGKNGKCLRKEKCHEFSGLIECGICGRRFKYKKTKYNPKYECQTYNELGKDCCASKGIPESVLKEEIARLLKLKEFDEAKMRARVSKIVAFSGNRLEVHFIDGRVETILWKDRSRSESWTPDMRETARQRNLARNGGRQNG